MNKNKFLLIATTVSVLFLTACGPAAEDRQAMHARAKIFQDSIANSIRATIAEAESPAAVPMPAPSPTNTAPAK